MSTTRTRGRPYMVGRTLGIVMTCVDDVGSAANSTTGGQTFKTQKKRGTGELQTKAAA